VNISFCKHDEGINWRATNFNRDAWVLMVGPPLDHLNTEDISACFYDIGTLLLWERDPNKKGRVVAKVRVTDLEDIPKSIRLTEGNKPGAESWTFLVEGIQQNLLGGGPPDEDPLPAEGVDPHPLANNLAPLLLCFQFFLLWMMRKKNKMDGGTGPWDIMYSNKRIMRWKLIWLTWVYPSGTHY
jgi:hypothetical protein